VGAILFYIDEFPAKLHHPKESKLLFPRVANRDPLAAKGRRDPVYDRLFTPIVMRAPAPIGVGGGLKLSAAVSG
jgi:hypothetical protein